MIKQLLLECLVFARNCANLYYHISSPQQSHEVSIINPHFADEETGPKRFNNLLQSHSLKMLELELEPKSL